MKRTLGSLLAPPFALAAALHAAQPLEIRFDTPPGLKQDQRSEAFFGAASTYPSSHWESQAQPVGNGRLGAMVFGNPLRERIQFNESSLWTGGANPSGGYDVNDFGAYQNFGDLMIEMTGAGAGPREAVCASGQAPSGSESVENAADGNPATKWCVEHQGREVEWRIDLGAARPLSGYSFTSANDVPSRDPRTWKLQGSADAKEWRTLDEHRDLAPFAKRGETRRYPLGGDKAMAFRHYRLVFQPVDATHFQVAGIELDTGDGPAAPRAAITGYSRSLDLRTGIHRTTWKHDGVVFTREVFASKPDECIVIRLDADRPEKLAGNIRLADAHGGTVTADGPATGFSGTLSNGLRYAARVEVRGGSPRAEAGGIAFSGGPVTLVLAAATDYALDPGRNFRSGNDPAGTAAKQSAKVAAKNYDVLRSSHIADFSPLMDRVDLDLGAPPAASITARLDSYKQGAPDTHLEALLFQYGRYLLLSSSRGFLPANLQGLWNDSNKPAWYSDYHTNINLQMNYWLAEPSNLVECAKPLFDWTEAMIPGSREATVKAFGQKTPGWTMRTSVNIFGGNGWEWNLPSSAWLARHFWEHYAFTGDAGFLERSAWPVLRDVSEFWLDHLVEKDGRLVVPKGWSPEHGPREDGVAHDQQIVWDLFTNTLEAAAAMRNDHGLLLYEKTNTLVRRVTEARAKLLGPQVGSWGQLMEWTSERPELEKSGHRHTSHLFAVFPGREISLNGTPDLAKAAAVSLESRGTSGDSRRSWTWPWRTALWARLGQPDKAGAMIRGLLVHNTLPNLFTTHPPFQIDGNLGITAGVCETLLQSHAGELAILPALPPAWKDGSVRGLLARGGFEAGATWKAGRLSTATLQSKLGKPVVLRLPGNPAVIRLAEVDGRETIVKAQADGTFRFATRKGTTYRITLL
jgi:alpha-L-fucosidase 2